MGALSCYPGPSLSWAYPGLFPVILGPGYPGLILGSFLLSWELTRLVLLDLRLSSLPSMAFLAAPLLSLSGTLAWHAFSKKRGPTSKSTLEATTAEAPAGRACDAETALASPAPAGAATPTAELQTELYRKQKGAAVLSTSRSASRQCLDTTALDCYPRMTPQWPLHFAEPIMVPPPSPSQSQSPSPLSGQSVANYLSISISAAPPPPAAAAPQEEPQELPVAKEADKFDCWVEKLRRAIVRAAATVAAWELAKAAAGTALRGRRRGQRPKHHERLLAAVQAGVVTGFATGRSAWMKERGGAARVWC